MASVSVIIPLYNKARYIARALDSVLGQTLQEMEVIVVDDGSTDGGRGLVEACRDPRVRIIRQANSGPGVARNRGIEESKGEYVAFLDADDEWGPDFLRESVQTLQRHRDCDLTAAAYYLGGEKSDTVPLFQARGIREGPWALDSTISDLHLEGCFGPINSSSTVFRRGVLSRLGGFYNRQGCTFGEDFYLWLKVILSCRIYLILKPLWWYHIEVSELGVRPGRLPLHPFVTDVDDIRAFCPPEKAGLLERWLALYALGMSHTYLDRGQMEEVEYLAHRFPLMRKWPLRYYSLRMKMKWPRLHRSLRRCVQRRVTLL
jgi:glycosyltransferase involved in cell wall biosynthesis